MNYELPDVQAGFRKSIGTRDQIANIRCITGKAREFQENIYFCFTDYTEAFDCVDHSKPWKILRDGNTRPPDPPLEIKKQQLELDMEQRTGSKSGKEYIKAVYCHLAYLTYKQSTSYKMPGWMKHKLELKFPGEISITSDTQMAPPLWQKAKN